MSAKTEAMAGAPTDKDAMAQSIERAFRFARAEFADPSILECIPNGASLALIPDDDPAAAARAIRAGIMSVERGKNVYFLHVHQHEDGALTVKHDDASGQDAME